MGGDLKYICLMIELHENVYGHKNRVVWFQNFLTKEDRILEFGCGTGIMVGAFLVQNGYDVHGVDLDCPSIELGQQMYRDNDLDPARLKCQDLADEPDHSYDVIIATEVFEHIEKRDIDAVMKLINSKLKPGGRLIITVPNGYGWFELESFIWNKLGVGWLLDKLMITKLAFAFKERVLGMKFNKLISTIAHSPHVRRFTIRSIKQLATEHNFSVDAYRGSCVFAGSFSALTWGGIKPLQNFNIFLGKMFPSISSGFYLYCTKP